MTIASNGASGVATTSPRVSLRATILGDNAPSDCDGTLRLARANLIESTAGCSTRGPAPIVGDPLLGPLQDNGGPTETQAPGVGSAAIGVLTGGCGGVDQRGVPRTKPCDLGAYETP